MIPELLDGVATGGRVLRVAREHAVSDGKGGCAFALRGDLVVEVARDGGPGDGDLLGYSYLNGLAVETTLVGPELPAPDAFEPVSVCQLLVPPARDFDHEASEEYGVSVVRALYAVKRVSPRVLALRYSTHGSVSSAFGAMRAIWRSGPNYEYPYAGPHPEIDVFGIVRDGDDLTHFHLPGSLRSTHGHPSQFQSFLVHTAVARTVNLPGYETVSYDVDVPAKAVARG